MSGERSRGAVLGLAVGDAAGWPASRHRSVLHAPWSRRLYRELETFAEEHRVTTLPVPFALNQPTAPLAVGPSDDAEWLAWTLLTIERPRAEAFRELAVRQDVRGRISVATALDNLAKGVEPPASGHDNPHFFDDAAAVRAVAFGLLGRDPVEDAQVTNAYDGVLGARAMAAAISAAVETGDVGAAVEAALAVLPEDTAIGHNAREARKIAKNGAFDAVPALDALLDDHVYSYAVGAAQTVPAALALAEAARGELREAVPAAACLASLADSAPALTGALTGACGGFDAIPEGWIAPARTLAGCCLPELAGRDIMDLWEELA
ncbi:MAG: ADP-ribosylglycohydrolase family protein [Nonomuraea sp.]|nr:ADP-ribosylglycohydrolase family protein [Nonomuraea sp.]